MKPTVGISDIGIYIPQNRISLEKVKEYRSKVEPKLERRLRAAIQSTGQKYIRFPNLQQDTVTIAAQAVRCLMNNKDDKWSKQRYHVVGTESTVDQAKPVSAYVNGALERKGYPINKRQTTFQVQHACAGGTAGLISVASLIASGHIDDLGIVTCADVARYETFSTAEITQGSGAAALLVENNPDLLELNLETLGFSSQDVDDFFRPNGSVIARVQGRYSMECYDNALEEAINDHAQRKGASVQNLLKEADMFVLHVPFYKMPYNALRKLISRNLNLHKEELDLFLNERCFLDSIEPIKYIGNTYTASTYISLAFQLRAMYNKYGDDLIGKKLLMASYGSGNTMIIIEATVASNAIKVIKNWDLDQLLNDVNDVDFTEYEDWINGYSSPEDFKTKRDSKVIEKDESEIYLSYIREDGFRIYE
ncbi:hydroxymethylglutaryl-CoA synthase family protein [Spirochaeta cellobiosiphila]|uniref:hydroxymethylglutaryl-CoA synthase family protein n=1 Tax=Spirochaeta cellobiosiphila TaxID=504483 RepID=UPI000413713F|nr:hydroxymethylglutaryl-CoA synthase [Spirochaeta cellobiosiphila]